MDEAPASGEARDEWMPRLSSAPETVEHQEPEKRALSLPVPPIRDWGKDSAFWAYYRLLGTHIMSSIRKSDQMAGKFIGRADQLI